MTYSGWGSIAGSEMNDRSRTRKVPFRDEEGLMSLIVVRGICHCPQISFSSSRGDDAGTDTSLLLGKRRFREKGMLNPISEKGDYWPPSGGEPSFVVRVLIRYAITPTTTMMSRLARAIMPSESPGDPVAAGVTGGSVVGRGCAPSSRQST